MYVYFIFYTLYSITVSCLVFNTNFVFLNILFYCNYDSYMKTTEKKYGTLIF